MKNSIFLLIGFCWIQGVAAQGVFSNRTNAALEQVIRDYNNQFNTIKGSLLEETPDAAVYHSAITIPGAVSCKVILYKQPVIQWQAVLYQTSDFDEAGKRFKELFSQLKNTIIKIEGDKPVILNGRFESPAADAAATIIPFDLLPANRFNRKLKVLLILQQTQQNWKIVLSVHDAEGASITKWTGN